MTLRRTPLARKTPLQAKAGLQRRTEMPRARAKRLANAQKPRTPPRDTGPSREVRAAVLDRAGGCCELCPAMLHDGDRWFAAHSIHHRRPRAAGGDPRPTTNLPSNLLLLCGSGIDGCHGRVERDRRAAYEAGWLVSIHDPAPGQVPVQLHVFPPFTPVWLTDTGDYSTEAP